MLNFSLWVNNYTFKDPASNFAYYLFSTHHLILWYLIVILVLVYWCLYKIIKDFSYKSFNKQEGILLFLINSYMLNIRILSAYYIYLFVQFFLQLVLICSDIRDMFNLGFGKSNQIIYYFSLIVLYIFSNLFGIQYNSYFIWESNNFVDKYGKPTFFKEFLLFDALNNNILVADFLNWNFTMNTITDKMMDKYVSSLLYHYTANGFFFNGVVDSMNFYTRTFKNYEYNSNVNVEEFILSDTLFESQGFKHSTAFEFVWALFPSVIIISILIPSLYLLYSLDEDLDPKLTIKVIGHQWYWSYEFNNWVEVSSQVFDFIGFKYDSMIVQTDELEFGTKRLLEVDKRLIVPVNVTLRFLITSGDVLHCWAIPELGIKIDAVPGRLNQFLSFITYPGVFYGQCSELCGLSHGFMPIVVQGVPYSNFVVWLKSIQ